VSLQRLLVYGAMQQADTSVTGAATATAEGPDSELDEAKQLQTERSAKKVKVVVEIPGQKDGRLAELTLPLGSRIREVGQAAIRQGALPIVPRLFYEGRLLNGGSALEPSDSLLEAGLPIGEAHLSAELCPAIVTASKDGTARIWNSETGVCEQLLEGHGGHVHFACFGPNCMSIATASEDKTAKLWRVDDGRVKFTLRGHTDAVDSAGFSEDGKWLVTSSEDKKGRVWNVKTGDCRCTLKGHDGPVLWASFTPDCQKVTTTSRDGTLRIWNPATGICDRTLSSAGPVYLTSFSPDGLSFATQSPGDCEARICNKETGECERTLVGHSDLIMSARYAPAVRGYHWR